jgi:hypothetical protein
MLLRPAHGGKHARYPWSVLLPLAPIVTAAMLAAASPATTAPMSARERVLVASLVRGLGSEDTRIDTRKRAEATLAGRTLSPRAASRVHVVAAIGFMLYDRYDEARPHLAEAIALDPENRDAHFVDACIAAIHADSSRAFAALDRAIDLGLPQAALLHEELKELRRNAATSVRFNAAWERAAQRLSP